MKRLAALLFLIAGAAKADPLYLPVSADFEVRAYQYAVESSAWNTPTIRLYPFQGSTPIDPSTYSWVYRFGESEYTTSMVTIAGSAGSNYVDFAITGADFSQPCYRWYSAFRAVSGTTVVTFARGYLTIANSPEVTAASYIIRTSPTGTTTWVESIVSTDGSVVNRGDSVDQDLSVSNYVHQRVTEVSTGLQAQVSSTSNSLQSQITGVSTLAYPKAQSDAKYATTDRVEQVAALVGGGSTSSYTKAESDARYATTNELAVLSLKVDTATNNLATVLSWGNHATNGYLTASSASNSFASIGGPFDIGGAGELVGRSQNIILSNYSGSAMLLIGDDGNSRIHGNFMVGGAFDSFGLLTAYDGIQIRQSTTSGLAVVSITVTGGLQIGEGSFHGETSGDIWHDPTNTAVLGILSASSIKNTNGASVLYAGEAPTISLWSAATAALAAAQTTIATLTAQVASLIAQVPALSNYVVASDSTITGLVAAASVSWTPTTSALSATNAWLFTQVTNRDHTVTTGLQASIAANLSTFSGFTNAYAAAITNVDAVTFGGTIKSGFMLASAWENVRTNVAFAFLGSIAATNTAGTQNYMFYSGTNTWLHDGTSWKWWSRYDF